MSIEKQQNILSYLAIIYGQELQQDDILTFSRFKTKAFISYQDKDFLNQSINFT